jgi:hypothetical protein
VGSQEVGGGHGRSRGPPVFERRRGSLLRGRVDACDWVVYIEPPETEDAQPEHVLKYLARYLTGGPISDRRLIAHQDGKVTFWVRSRDEGGGNPSEPYPLTGVEFTRRWALHILPKGFVKSRCFGGFSCRQRKAYLARCRTLIGSPPAPAPPPEASADEPVVVEPYTPLCPRCQTPMTCVSRDERVSWKSVVNGPHGPAWSRVVRPPPSRPHLGLFRREPRASGRIAHDRLPPHRRVASSRGPRQAPAQLRIWSHVEKPGIFPSESTRRQPLPPRSARSRPLAVSISGLLN